VKIGHREIVWGVLVGILGVALGNVPLFGVLGLELAVAVTIPAAIAAADLGRAAARKRLLAGEQLRGRAYLRSLGRAVLTALAVTAIPGVISAVRGIWQPTCDWTFGLLCYAALPLATAALFAAAGHAIGALAGPRRFLGAILAQLPFVLVAALALHRFYSEPPVYTYNAILGYFPGNLYDENITLHATLAWSRLEQLAWVAALTTLVLRDRRALVGGALAIVAAVYLHTVDTTTAEDIQEALGGRIETAHFVIYYAHTKEIDADIQLIAADHEFRYLEVVSELGAAPPGKLTSYYFADRAQKARWFGAHDVEMAKPWRREIYLDHRAFPHPSLRHEIAHAVASAFGDPVFGVSTRHGVFASPGLIEGLAVASDWPAGYDRPTPHEAVRALQLMGTDPSITPLLSLQFFSASSARSYTIAGSFMKFLLDSYGARKFRTLYESGGDFEGAYGKDLATLDREWKAMIAKIQLPAGAVEAQRERFRVGSVFSRPCPHAIAARRDHAFAAAADGDHEQAIALMRHVCDDAPEEPRHRLDLADVLAGGTHANRDEARAIWEALAADAEHITSSLRQEAYDRLAHAAARDEDPAALLHYIAAADALPLDSNEKRQADAEQLALTHDGPAAAALHAYFFAPGIVDGVIWAQLAVAAEPNLGFAHYLLGLQNANQGNWTEATADLAEALRLGLSGPLFVENAARRLAVAAYRTEDPAKLRVAIAALRAAPTEGDHLLALDWEERLLLAPTFTSR
jgi:hypothetical protein